MTEPAPYNPPLAGDIVVTKTPDGFLFTIDGVPFPWAVTDGGITLDPVSSNAIPTVTVRIPANRIDVFWALTTRPEPEPGEDPSTTGTEDEDG